jgi:hypothetical protein
MAKNARSGKMEMRKNDKNDMIVKMTITEMPIWQRECPKRGKAALLYLSYPSISKCVLNETITYPLEI